MSNRDGVVILFLFVVAVVGCLAWWPAVPMAVGGMVLVAVLPRRVRIVERYVDRYVDRVVAPTAPSVHTPVPEYDTDPPTRAEAALPAPAQLEPEAPAQLEPEAPAQLEPDAPAHSEPELDRDPDAGDQGWYDPTAPRPHAERDSAPEHVDLGEAFDPIEVRFALARQQGLLLDGLFRTESPALREDIEYAVGIASKMDVSVLFLGPSGSGKTALARAFHKVVSPRRRRSGPFVDVNCATLQPSLAASQLFGHAKGAFTDAKEAGVGFLRTADGGTLLLDEIGALPLEVQSQLLTVLENGRFRPVSATADVTVDVWFLAATSRDLDALAAQGLFNPDLLERLKGLVVRLPPLSERPSDVARALTEQLDVLSQQHGRAFDMTPEARDAWLVFVPSPLARWGASFRSHAQAVTRMVGAAPGDTIDLETVNKEIARLTAQWGTGSRSPSLETLVSAERLDEACHADIHALVEAVRVCREFPNQRQAALFLYRRKGIDKNSESSRLIHYLRSWGLTYAMVVGRDM